MGAGEMKEYVKLSEVCNIIMGQSPESNSYNELGNGLPFFQGNADFGELYPVTKMWCTEPKKIVEKNTLLISVRAPIGALNFSTERCCIGRGLAGITAKAPTDLKYIYYGLMNKKEELNRLGTGSTFKAINKKVLENTLIVKEKAERQHNIVKVLDKNILIIAHLQKQLYLLDELVKSRFIEMFGDVIRNSKVWQMRVFEDIAVSRLGKMLDAKRQTGKYSYPYLANFNVQWFRFNIENLNQMDFNEDDREEFELKDGDLLVCEGGEIGRCAVWHNEIQPCFFQKALHRVRCNRQIIHPDYLALWFKYNCDHDGFTAIVGSKATIAHLPSIKLKQLQVAVPPIKLQEQFATFVAQTDKSRLLFKCQLLQYHNIEHIIRGRNYG